MKFPLGLFSIPEKLELNNIFLKNDAFLKYFFMILVTRMNNADYYQNKMFS